MIDRPHLIAKGKLYRYYIKIRGKKVPRNNKSTQSKTRRILTRIHCEGENEMKECYERHVSCPQIRA
jgi:hypothetical protein